MTVIPFRYFGDGSISYALGRIYGMLWPTVTLSEPEPGSIIVERNVAVPMRDGICLRVNVFRPTGEGPFPILVSAHPYGKDNFPTRGLFGYHLPFQYRALRQTGTIPLSTLTTWEAPDPVWWCKRGYTLINVDLRGAGTSEGTGSILTIKEGEDVYDVIEWAAKQPWSNGSVGMIGISYLAISQYQVAALHPPSLKAICPWEGFTDAYSDLLMPGGVRENGFIKIWNAGIKSVRLTDDLIDQQNKHPLRDEYWESLVPDLSKIGVPMLACTSFSDNNLHSRGSWRAFMNVDSKEKYAYTHRSGKWAVFYNEPALSAQLAFFERYLKGRTDVPVLPRVRLEVRASRTEIVDVRDENEYPLARTKWAALYLSENGKLADAKVNSDGSETFDTRNQCAVFAWTFLDDTELTGPMSARLWVSSPDLDDLDLIIGIEKWSDGKFIPFEGSYGFGRDRVTTGWQRASLRSLDEKKSTDYLPVTACTKSEKLQKDQIVEVPIAMGHSATAFKVGESIRLVIACRWLTSTSPFTGNFPAYYVTEGQGHCTVHWGKEYPSSILVPIIPKRGA